MGAISSVNLLINDIGVDQANALVSILKEHSTLKSLCGNTGNETELDMSSKMYGAGDAIMLVPEIIDNGALSSLSLKNNRLATKEAGTVLVTALAANSVLKELDLSSNAWEYNKYEDVHADGAGFAHELAVGIKDNGALLSLNLSSNDIGGYWDGSTVVATPEGALLLATTSVAQLLVAHTLYSTCRPS
jgi:hypothetical protein